MVEVAASPRANHLLDTVLHFADCCRASELFVSTAEILDTVNQLCLIDLLDESAFKTLLNANFVKTQRDQPKFEALYRLFFHDLAISPADADVPPDTDATDTRNILNDLRDHYRNSQADSNRDDPVIAVLMDFLEGRPQPWLNFLRELNNADEEARQIPLRSNLGEMAQRLGIMLKINQLRARSRELAETRLADDQVTRRAVENHFQSLLDRADDLFWNAPQPDNVGLREVDSAERPFRNIGETPLANLSPAEIDAIRDIIDRLVNKLKDVASRRQAARRRGALDVSTTLRRANRYQGIPMSLVFKTHPPRKSKIVTLCDVSGSVWSTARFMLSVLYALQDCFSGVKSYVFVAGVADVSDLFQAHDINTAIEKIFSDKYLSTAVPTDYGETFLRFRESHLHELTRRTTMIIIGDGRSNYMNPRVDVLNELRKKCRRIIWLNPEPLVFWDKGDSDMRLFRKYCHEIRPCQNLNQLWAFVEDLVL